MAFVHSGKVLVLSTSVKTELQLFALVGAQLCFERVREETPTDVRVIGIKRRAKLVKIIFISHFISSDLGARELVWSLC